MAIAQSKKYKRTFPFLISGILQIVLIIGANYYKGYFFVPRQIIHVAPFFMIYAAVGIFEWPNLFIKSTKMKMITMIFLCVFVFFATTINTIEYYEKPKSNMREIAAMLGGIS
ncbi:MAG: hypothetical protein M5U34_33355 [Chloroflexi bacterium]|nr:hypothetical protein [Chloroflexota bacterium]